MLLIHSRKQNQNVYLRRKAACNHIALSKTSVNEPPSRTRPTHLEFIHDAADALSTGADDARVDPAVQSDVLGDHLLQLLHDGLDGVACSYGFVLIPCNGNLVLWKEEKKQKNTLNCLTNKPRSYFR